jgi:hypothetical protein
MKAGTRQVDILGLSFDQISPIILVFIENEKGGDYSEKSNQIPVVSQ